MSVVDHLSYKSAGNHEPFFFLLKSFVTSVFFFLIYSSSVKVVHSRGFVDLSWLGLYSGEIISRLKLHPPTPSCWDIFLCRSHKSAAHVESWTVAHHSWWSTQLRSCKVPALKGILQLQLCLRISCNVFPPWRTPLLFQPARCSPTSTSMSTTVSPTSKWQSWEGSTAVTVGGPHLRTHEL